MIESIILIKIQIENTPSSSTRVCSKYSYTDASQGTMLTMLLRQWRLPHP
jgi:hypothetical protein